MLNQVVLVGRLVRDFKVNESSDGKQVATLTLAVPRSFKNHDGLYDTDFIDCILWDMVALNTSNYCRKGDIIGIKGRIQSRIVEEETGNKTVIQVIAEKVTFLSSKREEQEKNE